MMMTPEEKRAFDKWREEKKWGIHQYPRDPGAPTPEDLEKMLFRAEVLNRQLTEKLNASYARHKALVHALDDARR